MIQMVPFDMKVVFFPTDAVLEKAPEIQAVTVIVKAFDAESAIEIARKAAHLTGDLWRVSRVIDQK